MNVYAPVSVPSDGRSQVQQVVCLVMVGVVGFC